MLTLAYGCGLRASEVVRLRACDIDSEQTIIRVVQSKSGKDRNVMLPAEILDLLRQWWKARPTRRDAGVAPERRWLFPGRIDRQPTTARQFGRLFKEAAKAAGLRKSVSIHSLRHSFATHLLGDGKDIRLIQALLETDTYCPTTTNRGTDHYPFHPRCGETVLILRQFAYRGTIWSSFLSRRNGSLYPAWMTPSGRAT